MSESIASPFAAQTGDGRRQPKSPKTLVDTGSVAFAKLTNTIRLRRSLQTNDQCVNNPLIAFKPSFKPPKHGARIWSTQRVGTVSVGIAI